MTSVPDDARTCGFIGTELRSYRCELRDDLRLPNGNRITEEDVKYPFDRALAIKADIGPQSLFATLRSVECDVTGAQYLSDGTGIWRLWQLGWL
ncbi:hypothetical protein ACFXKS_26945 [Streptomyces scopuliridis]|uniref:hypothetical protein n=1 Tax=Streptomyces scopuliridis TaxID=452529 RepID=UPI0036B95AA0